MSGQWEPWCCSCVQVLDDLMVVGLSGTDWVEASGILSARFFPCPAKRYFCLQREALFIQLCITGTILNHLLSRR